jgi:hypothetical protein
MKRFYSQRRARTQRFHSGKSEEAQKATATGDELGQSQGVPRIKQPALPKKAAMGQFAAAQWMVRGDYRLLPMVQRV